MFFSELLLPNAQAIEACRRRHPRVGEPWFDGRSEFVRAAVQELRSEMAGPISRVREIYRLRSPKGLVNVDSFFEERLDSALTSVLVADH